MDPRKQRYPLTLMHFTKWTITILLTTIGFLAPISPHTQHSHPSNHELERRFLVHMATMPKNMLICQFDFSWNPSWGSPVPFLPRTLTIQWAKSVKLDESFLCAKFSNNTFFLLRWVVTMTVLFVFGWAGVWQYLFWLSLILIIIITSWGWAVPSSGQAGAS